MSAVPPAPAVSGDIAPLVLFDLDGTLVDSAADLFEAMRVVCAEAGVQAPAFAPFRAVVSKGARAMLAVAFPGDDAAAREARVPGFLAHYAAGLAAHSRPFEGVEAVLAAIEAAGARWGIVTNKPYALAEPLVARLGWTARCAVLVGGDTLPVKKPDPAPLRHACAACGVDAARAVYVGDDLRDVEAARAAGMRAVAALWGYREDGDDPAAWGADALLARPLDLAAPGALAAFAAAEAPHA